jgi:hypothetical protein
MRRLHRRTLLAAAAAAAARRFLVCKKFTGKSKLQV